VPQYLSRRGFQPAEHAQQGRLSGPGRSKQCHDGVPVDSQVGGSDHLNPIAIGLRTKLSDLTSLEIDSTITRMAV
jgi:hypothetical protein